MKGILAQMYQAAKEETRTSHALNAFNYQRLLAQIDRNQDGVYSEEEYLQAVHNRSYRDALCRIIARHGSEWYYEKGDPLWKNYLEPLTKEAPLWKAYTEAFIEKITWMKAVPGMGPEPWHMHPVAFLDGLDQKTDNVVSCSFCHSGIKITPELLVHCFGISYEKADLYAPLLNHAFVKYEINNCLRISHFLGQIGVETQRLTKFKEGFYYTNGDRLWRIYYTQLNLGLSRRFPNYTEEQRKQYTKDHLVRNEDELAKTLFPSDFVGMDYRGRGLIHLTHKETYEKYKTFSGNDVISNPRLLEEDPALAVDSACWFWSTLANINPLADADNLSALTYKVNAARLDMSVRGDIKDIVVSYIKQNSTRCIK